ncbi:MAG: acylase [Alphaproteobacteria bacterium]|nr:acylase [Alphaproteobacteria bacterium]
MSSEFDLRSGVCLIGLLSLMSSCAVGPSAGEAQSGQLPSYQAEIRRTAYGVPHVKAKDYAGLGFGIGYASAEDNLCELLERMITVNGERARYLGPGDKDANIISDIYHKRLIQTGELETLLTGAANDPDTPSQASRDLGRGYAAGVSRYIRDRAGSDLKDPRCKGAPWIREMTETDYWRHVLAGQVLYQPAGVAAAAPPDGPSEQRAALDDPLVETLGLGSNAYGLGREVTRSGRGVLLANPHYPWDGQNRFYRMHMMIPGELNVVGAGLVTNATIGIGHTESIAWTHTVSTARRFGYFELALDPADPTRYLVDGKSVPMTKMTVKVDVKDASPVERTLYTTEFGPVVETETLPWTKTRAYAISYVPQGVRSPDQYLAIWKSRSVRELREALGRYQATGFNTTATDSQGETFFGDMGMIPNVSEELARKCSASELARKQWAEARIPVLDGSRSECRWANVSDSTAPGVFGSSRTPQLFRTDYVSQSNDSHWLTNPEQPLEGYSPIFGDERTQRSLRTRLAIHQIEDREAGRDGLPGKGFDLRTLQSVIFRNRHLGAEMIRDDLVSLCRTQGGPDLARACEALAKWDLRVDADSRGAHLFHLFAEAGGIQFSTAFSASDPVATPRMLNREDPRVLSALRGALKKLDELGISPEARLGDVQVETRNGERIPIHGGAGPEGVFNVITVEALEPKLGWTSIRHGSSWIMAVEFTPEGPISQGVLTYSQSTDPTSPNYSDQTKLYSDKGWDDLRFSETAIEAGLVSKTVVSEGPEDCAEAGWKRFGRATFAGESECRRLLANEAVRGRL